MAGTIDAAWYLRSMLCDNAVRTMGVQYFVIITYFWIHTMQMNDDNTYTHTQPLTRTDEPWRLLPFSVA